MNRHYAILTGVLTLLAGLSTAAPLLAAGPGQSARPTPRSTPTLVAAVAKSADTEAPEIAGDDAGLRAWVLAFRPRALEAGIEAEVFDRALDGVRYDDAVIRRDRNQSEFTKTVWDYLGTATSDLRVQNGGKALAQWQRTLEDIEAKYGVEKEVVTAIWGLESAYGSFRGSDNVINSLATLAYDARRREFFEGELISALRILQAGDVAAEEMRGSWAGAMGHTQFMPSSFLAHAVDWNGDGRRDIWGDDPSDALASTAAYLKHFGWTEGQPWGIEVALPEEFDYLLADRSITKSAEEWTALGLTKLDGTALDAHGPAAVLLPAGAEGAAFLIYDNFAVIETYNTADAYVIGVGHLSDRIGGAGPIRQSWPRDDRALSYDERIELQTLLTEAGFDTEKIDAKIGPLTVNAVRRYQQDRGLVPDGYAPPRLLERLRNE
ncbi:lytic murein transglycosylase [Sulfitobacter sp. S0837]|uniref:lytic murein transglycosylase n=1 Tax=Sulfitobacter maritimus TaxID=2741719 RepID=UPI0015837CDE|nr:lytic murein transglycosylase [Sulfitobacter maritimus]NUH66804.1 lytic murein transglycosylase [Sulfitobacter maritimus]